jgi:hypothetical protein
MFMEYFIDDIIDGNTLTLDEYLEIVFHQINCSMNIFQE